MPFLEIKCRFSFASQEQLQTASKGVVSLITEKSNKWALKAFDEWRSVRNTHFGPEEKCPDNLLSGDD